MLDTAVDEGRIVREGDPEWREEVPVRVESIPVRREGRVLGVIARNTNLLTVRTPSRLELTYLQSASDLAQMIAAGSFPFPGQQVDMDASPRVGDGLMRLDNLFIEPAIESRIQTIGRDLLSRLDQLHRRQRPGQPNLDARIASYELAARMQLAATDALDISKENRATQEMYGIGREPTSGRPTESEAVTASSLQRG